MTEELELKAADRAGEKVSDLRNSGKIPANVYGSDFKNRNVAVEALLFNRIFSEAGESSLIDLVIENSEPIKVLVHEVQLDPVTMDTIHIDFYKVNMKEKIKTEIPLKIIGTSSAIEELEGTLVTNKDSVEVECLPSDLVHEIEVDISILRAFDDVIKIADIKAPTGIEILDDPEEVAILVQPPRSEKELAELEEKPEEDVETVEVEAEKKEKEGEEAVEGEGAEVETGEVKPIEEKPLEKKSE